MAEEVLWIYNDYNVSGNCDWVHLFSNEERKTYNDGLFYTCCISEFALLWVHTAIVRTELWKDINYRYLIFITVPSSARRFQLMLSRLFDKNDKNICVFFAYCDSLFGTLEIEGLTHACIIRFVMARYAAKGWRLSDNLWKFFMLDTVAFAVVYTFLPLTGYGGSYGDDYTCTACTYNVILPNYTFERFLNVVLFFLRYIKPVMVMLIAVTSAYYMEQFVCRDNGHAARKPVTRMMLDIAFIYIQCCGMAAIVNFYAIVYQLTGTDFAEFEESGQWIQWSNWLHALWPTFAVIVMMVRDRKLLRKMIEILTCVIRCKKPRREQLSPVREEPDRYMEYLDEDYLTCRRG